MKLLRVTNCFYLLFTAAILLIAGIVLYLVVIRLLTEEIEEKQQAQCQEIISHIEHGGEIPDFDPYVKVLSVDSLPWQRIVRKDTLPRISS